MTDFTPDWDSRFWRNVHPEALSGCWLWHGAVDRKGYGRFKVGSRTDGTARALYAHRHAYELVNGPISVGLHACHACDVPSCVRADHLFLGTNAENIADMDAKGRRPRGERSHCSKLTSVDVAEIRRWHASRRASLRSLAAEHGVSPSAIRKIVFGETWAHEEVGNG